MGVRVQILLPFGSKTLELRSGAEVSIGSSAGVPGAVVVPWPPLAAPLRLTLRCEDDAVLISEAPGSEPSYIDGRRLVRRAVIKRQECLTCRSLSIRILPLAVDLAAAEQPAAEVPPAVTVPAGHRDRPAARSTQGVEDNGTVRIWHREASIRALAVPPPEKLYAILDLSRDRRILRALTLHTDRYESLYEGERAGQSTGAGPHLVEFHPDSNLLSSVFSDGWGQGWGIYVVSRESFHELRHHLRRFLTVRYPDSTKVFFRFFDPAVLQVFLPVATSEQATETFRLVRAFVTEAEDQPDDMIFFELSPGLISAQARQRRGV